MHLAKHMTLAAVAGLIVVGIAGSAAADGTVTVLTPGGSVQEGGRAALWGPAGKALGIDIKEETIDEALNGIRLQVGAGAVTTDIVVLADYESVLGAKEGLLEPLDYSLIDASGFLPGTARSHCIGIYGYATVLAWNTATYADKAPSKWADFFDVAAFPGKRAMRGNAETQLEVALLADGVAPGDLYEVLSTDAGVTRAVDKIATLKPDIAVWWSSGSQHAQLMKDGEVDMSTGWNGRFQSAIAAGGKVAYTFNQGILATDCLAVPKGAPNKDLAMKMIAAMSTAKSQAELTKYITYGPVIPAAFDLGIIPPETAKILPTNPAYIDKLIIQDIDWWVAHNDAVKARYEDMMTE